MIESLAAAGAFDTIEPNRARVFAGADAILAACQRSHEAATIGQHDIVRRRRRRADHASCPRSSRGCRRSGCRSEYDAIGFFLSGHPLDDYAAALKRLRVQSWAEFTRAVKTGATAGKVAATVVSRMERRTKTGNKMGIMGLSDPTGHFEAVLFSEGLAQYRDMLEPGAAVLLQLGAELQGEDVRARILHAEPLDAAAAKTQMGLRIFLRDTKPLESIAKRLSSPLARNGSGQGLGRAGARRASNGRRRGDAGDAARPRNRGGNPTARAASRSRRRSPAPSRRCRAWWTCRRSRSMRRSICAPKTGHKAGPISLLIRARNRVAISPPSHTGAWLEQAVRWHPGRKARLLTRSRRNQPENYTNGAS